MRSARSRSQPPELPPDATDDDVSRLVWKQLRTCYDPEIPVNIVDLGLVYDCSVLRNDERHARRRRQA